MEAGQRFAGKSENSLLRLQFALVSAQVALTSDHPRSSQRPLEQVVQLARLHGFVGIELDARLALAQLATRIEPAATPHEKLRILEKDARAKGFGLIARKAAAARAGLPSGRDRLSDCFRREANKNLPTISPTISSRVNANLGLVTFVTMTAGYLSLHSINGCQT
jgi:hypothetical protein